MQSACYNVSGSRSGRRHSLVNRSENMIFTCFLSFGTAEMTEMCQRRVSRKTIYADFFRVGSFKKRTASAPVAKGADMYATPSCGYLPLCLPALSRFCDKRLRRQDHLVALQFDLQIVSGQSIPDGRESALESPPGGFHSNFSPAMRLDDFSMFSYNCIFVSISEIVKRRLVQSASLPPLKYYSPSKFPNSRMVPTPHCAKQRQKAKWVYEGIPN